MADWGIKISKPGVDVGTAGAENLVLTSQIPLIKVKTEAKVTLTGPATETVAHGLPYTPLFWCFRNKNGTSTPGTLEPIYDSTTGRRAYIDGTNLTIIQPSGAPAPVDDYYYYIFYDEAGSIT